MELYRRLKFINLNVDIYFKQTYNRNAYFIEENINLNYYK